MSSPGDPPRLGALVRRLRVNAALSQEALAERAGLSVRALSDLERGVHRAPRLETVRMLTEALGLGAAERGDLLAAAHPDAEAPRPPMRSRPNSLAALPLPPTRLIGREAEVAALSGLLARDDVRLVTMTGSGGTGKTHLALHVAAAAVGRYRDGVHFVDLSALTEPRLVMPAIAAALGVRDAVDAPLRETVSAYLRDRQLLLLLDNCEQVLGAASEIAALLAACQHLEVLATSREPLHIRAEREFAVAPLPLPSPGDSMSPDGLGRGPAIALFVERARAASADFALSADNAAAIAAICVRLDGLPLAIELAAARIKTLPLAALLARLEQRLPLLTGGGRDLPARQRTMRDAIAWSYELLSPEGQALFRHLAVFSGGFTLPAAEAVVAFQTSSGILDGIGALIDQSLLRQTIGARGQPRYQMLETVREFGLERLSAAGEADDARSRHARQYLGLSTSLNMGLWSDWNLEQIVETTVEYDNVRLALTWFHQRGEGTSLLRLAAVLYGLWIARGLYSEGVQWVELALDQSNHVEDIVRFQALRAVGILALLKGDLTRAAACIDECLILSRAFDDPVLMSEAMTSAGLLAYRRGEHGQAEELLTESVQLFRALPAAVPDAYRAAAAALRSLGDNALAQEQVTVAAGWYEESFHLASNSWGLADGHAGLGAVSFCLGDYVSAAAHYMQCLDNAQDLGGDTLLIATFLQGMAGIAASTGGPERGARLLGAAENIVAFLGAPTFPRDTPVRERALAAMTAALGEERLAVALEAGCGLTAEQAIAEARTVAEAVWRPSP